MDWFNPSFNDFAFSFLSVLFEGIPFLLLGSVISGLIDVFVSSERISRLLPKNATAAIGISGVMGLILPMCECGSVIVIRRFIRKGLPVASAVTYMLAAPIVSPIVAMSTYAAFKGQNPLEVTALRLSLGFAIAVTIGLIVRHIPLSSLLQPQLLGEPLEKRRAGLRMAAAPGQPDFSDLAGAASLPRKLLLSVQSATADFLDVAFFFVIGTAVTSVFNTAVSRDVIEPFATNAALAIPAMMVLAALIALCSTTDAFIAATFTSFPFAAKLAFMLFGPVFDLKLFWLYGLIFRRRWVIALAITLFVIIAFVCGRIATLPW
ncbi:MAG: permease [Verrucomicrobiota bacterium]|nr:permease [Verrucomicrobiota bacterium]